MRDIDGFPMVTSLLIVSMYKYKLYLYIKPKIYKNFSHLGPIKRNMDRGT